MRQTPERIAPEEVEMAAEGAERIIWAVLPFLMEREAIAMFVRKNPRWRGYLPLIEDSVDAATLGQRETMQGEMEMWDAAEYILDLMDSGIEKPDVTLLLR